MKYFRQKGAASWTHLFSLPCWDNPVLFLHFELTPPWRALQGGQHCFQIQLWHPIESQNIVMGGSWVCVDLLTTFLRVSVTLFLRIDFFQSWKNSHFWGKWKILTFRCFEFVKSEIWGKEQQCLKTLPQLTLVYPYWRLFTTTDAFLPYWRVFIPTDACLPYWRLFTPTDACLPLRTLGCPYWRLFTFSPTNECSPNIPDTW